MRDYEMYWMLDVVSVTLFTTILRIDNVTLYKALLKAQNRKLSRWAGSAKANMHKQAPAIELRNCCFMQPIVA